MTSQERRPMPAYDPHGLTRVVSAVQEAVAAITGVHNGRLDQIVSLSSHMGAPVMLGFLNLGLKLETPTARTIEPVRAAARVEWMFTPTRLTLTVAADVGQAGDWQRVMRLVTSITPGITKPGSIGLAAEVSTRSIPIHGKKGPKHKVIPVWLSLYIVEQARPIGSIPQASNGQWLNFQA